MINVIYNVHPYAMDLPGGGEMQILKYVHYMPKECNVILHDIWHPRLREARIFHHFHLVSGGLGFLSYVKGLQSKVVVSPNLWINASNSARIDYDEMSRYYEICDVVICNSKMEIDNLAHHSALPREKARVVPNGVDAFFMTPTPAAEFRAWAGIDGPFLLSVGNIETRKNQIGAIKAAKSIGLPLVCIGRIRERDYFDACVREGTGGSFRFVGQLEQNDPKLVAAYQSCEAFLFPSLLETPGIAALEAAVAGARIVTTQEGSGQEYFVDLVDYVDPLDQSSIDTAVARALSRPKSEALQQHVIQRYLWDQVVMHLLGHYLELTYV